MPRNIIAAAALAMLLLLAPAASARPVDTGYPAYPSPTVAPPPNHYAQPTAAEIKQALAQEQSYSTKGNPNVADNLGQLVREQESTSGSGNQGPSSPAPSNPVTAPSHDDFPWLIVALGLAGAALAGGAVVAHRNRTRAHAAA